MLQFVLSGRNLFVFLRIVFNTVLHVCYSVLWPQFSNKYLLTYFMAISADCFRCLLKTYLFGRYQCMQHIRGY